MLPMIQREIIDRRGWATEDEVLDYYAVAQCTPGVIAVNTATFVGSSRRGFWGALCATLGVVTPSFIIILAIATLLKNFSDNVYVVRAFAGIRVAVAALIVSAVINLIKKNIGNWFQIVLCVLAFLIVAILGWSPVYVVIGAAAAGLVYGWAVKMT